MVRLTIHEKAGYLAHMVLAASDGIVTTFAVVAGSAGASLGSGVVLILGFANLFADGFSMAAGNYLGVKSEIAYEEANRTDGSGEGTPLRHGVLTFIAFNLAGFLPLLPFVLNLQNEYVISTLLVGLSLLVVGFLRGYFIKKNMVKSAVEMFTVGGLAAFVAFLIGFLIENFVLKK